jgi:hypothetical protein
MRKNTIVLFSLGILIALAACAAPKELGSISGYYEGEKAAVYAVAFEAVSAASAEFESDRWVVSQDDIENHFLQAEASMCCLKNFIGLSSTKRYETALSVKITQPKKGTRVVIDGGRNTADMADRIWESLDASFRRVRQQSLAPIID